MTETSAGETWVVRVATENDRNALTEFVCANGTEVYQTEVQDFIRTRLWEWRDSVAPAYREQADPQVLLVVDEPDGSIVAVGAHEVVCPTRDPSSWYRRIWVVAVSVAHQGVAGPGGHRASDVIMSAVLSDAITRSGGSIAVVATVHRENQASLRMCDRHGLTRVLYDGDPDYTWLVTERI